MNHRANNSWPPPDDPESWWHDVERECAEGKVLTIGGLIVAWCLFVGTLAGAVALWRHR